MVFLGLFYFLPAGLLTIPWVQQKISNIASEKLHATLGVPVNIGNIDFAPFNKLVLKDLYLEDQQGEVLFQAKRLGVGFDILPLFRGKIRFSSAQLFNFQLNLTKENEHAPLNLRFVMDAFASKDTTKKSDIDLVIKNLNLRRGVFTFNVQDTPETRGKFNARHIVLRDISSKIQIRKLTGSELIAEVNRLSFKEQSGFFVRRVAFGLEFSADSASIEKMEILLPGSSLFLENILADFREVSGLGDYINHSQVSLQIAPSEIRLPDFDSFAPVFAGYKDVLDIQGKLSGKINRLQLNDFLLADKDKLMVHANLSVENLMNEKEVFVSGSVKKSFISVDGVKHIADNLMKESTDFPESIFRLGNIRFEGEMSGYFHRITAFGLFNTDIGSIQTDVVIGKNGANFIHGEIRSQDIDLEKLFMNDDYGIANFNILVDAQQSQNGYEGTVNARINNIEYKRYTYENVDFKGNFTEQSFDGTLDADAPEGKLSAKGLFKLNGNQSVFNFEAQARRIKLDRLNLSRKYKDSDLSFDLDVDMTGFSMDNLLGYVSVKDIRFSTEKGEYYLDTLTVSSYLSETNEKLLSIRSNLLNATMIGNYSVKDIVPALRETGSTFLPALVKSPQREIISENCFGIDVTIKDLEQLAYVFDLPFILYGDTKIQGNYDRGQGKFDMQILSPKFELNNMQFKDCRIKLENKNDKEARLWVDVTQQKNNKTNKVVGIFDIAGNHISSELKWNDRSDPYNGLINVSTKFTEQQGAFPLKTEIDLLASEATFKSALWNINPAQIVLDSAKIKIDRFSVNHSDEYAMVNGVISRDPQDSLWVDLNKVNLDYIFDILNLRSFEMGGIVSGQATAKDLYHTRQLSTLLTVKNFSFNKSVVGDLKLLGTWDNEQQGIQLLGNAYKNDFSNMLIDGIIFPVEKYLDLKFEAQNVDAAFLRRYLDKVTKDISGLITGDINLYGRFSGITFSGDAFVKDGSFGIDFLNTTYTFSDSIHLKPDEIAVRNVTFYDKFGNKALGSGSVRHEFLKDFVFSANLNTSNFLVFNATERKNPMFFGSAFGTGSLAIRGNRNQIDFDVRMRTNENTRMTLNFMEQRDIEEFNFINFSSRKTTESNISLDEIFSQFTGKPIIMQSDSKSDLNFNLWLTATPDATIELIMDPVSGDRIKGYGQGDIRIQYGTSAPLKIFGNYALERGVYNFSFQQAIHRDFQIRDGSSIAFNGDPFAATLDVDAIYPLTANIADLSETLAQESSRMRIPVNCVLEIAGALARPDIRFDIEVQNSDENLERQIKAIVNTEEMMNRQIVYLLVLNRFYTMETEATTTQRNNEFASLATSTLSSQLSNLLGSLNENVQVGAFYTTNSNSVFTDTEMALMLSSQLLNNRLIINGNLGYRDNTAMNTTFIGDIDVEWKLTRAGDIRLRAYNHYNDRYYSLRSAYTTQGVGLLFRKDFNLFNDLFRSRRRTAFPLLMPAATSSYTLPENDFIRFK